MSLYHEGLSALYAYDFARAMASLSLERGLLEDADFKTNDTRTDFLLGRYGLTTLARVLERGGLELMRLSDIGPGRLRRIGASLAKTLEEARVPTELGEFVRLTYLRNQELQERLARESMARRDAERRRPWA